MADISPEFYDCLYSFVYDDPEDKSYQIKYSGFVPKLGHIIVLFSALDNLPIAVLQFRFNESDNDVSEHNALITELPNEGRQSFQGTVTANFQKIELVVTNLTNDYVNANIISLESVNLKPFESRSIIISEAEELSEIRYIYTYLTPRTGDTVLSERFEHGTFWKPVDCFVVKFRYRKDEIIHRKMLDLWPLDIRRYYRSTKPSHTTVNSDDSDASSGDNGNIKIKIDYDFYNPSQFCILEMCQVNESELSDIYIYDKYNDNNDKKKQNIRQLIESHVGNASGKIPNQIQIDT
jgi:hypothetical protein